MKVDMKASHVPFQAQADADFEDEIKKEKIALQTDPDDFFSSFGM